MLEKKIIFVLIVGLTVFTLLFVGILAFILLFRKSKMHHLEELMKTKLEIQDQTLTYIGRELHDNLGQLLTVSKIHVNSLTKQYSDDKKIAALDDVLDKTIVELRALSKSLNNSRIKDFGLHKELSIEVDRIAKLNVVDISLNIEGNHELASNDKSIILYRIIQEFLSNSMKYSEANKIVISLIYHENTLDVSISDNGKGFDMNQMAQGSGVTNIKNRAQLLNADKIEYNSIINQGTQLSLTLPNE
ncbi:MAG TPA: ATP-binding protein [Chitinophagaceae bacterium]|jgi:signal transduction histidine kinase|nr:ATP-binding protein [Chitinophagaceae bacterium]